MTNTIILDVKHSTNHIEVENKKGNIIEYLKSQGYKTHAYKKLIDGYYHWCIDFKKEVKTIYDCI